MGNISAVIPDTLAQKLEDYCYTLRTSKSKLVCQLIEEWADKQAWEAFEKESQDDGLASEEDLREAVKAGIVSAEEVGLK